MNKTGIEAILRHLTNTVDLRDKIFHYNQRTRTNLVQKYPREIILSETQFVDIREWQLKRAEKGAIALEEAGKPYRFKKGGRNAS